MNVDISTLAPTQVYHLITQGDRLKVDALAVDPISRLGGSEYATLDKTFSIARPQ